MDVALCDYYRSSSKRVNVYPKAFSNRIKCKLQHNVNLFLLLSDNLVVSYSKKRKWRKKKKRKQKTKNSKPKSQIKRIYGTVGRQRCATFLDYCIIFISDTWMSISVSEMAMKNSTQPFIIGKITNQIVKLRKSVPNRMLFLRSLHVLNAPNHCHTPVQSELYQYLYTQITHNITVLLTPDLALLNTFIQKKRHSQSLLKIP